MLPVLVLAAVAALLLSPGLWTGPSLDAAVFVTAADAMLEGRTLYVDVWDHKPPGVYLLFAGAQGLLGNPWMAVWLVSLVSLVAIGCAVSEGVRAAGHSPRAGWLLGFLSVALAGQYLVSLGGGMTELPATAMAAASLLALRSSVPRRRFLGGVLLAASFLTSLVLVPAGLAAAALLFRRPRRSQWISVAAGFVATLTICALWLLWSGAFAQAWEAVVGYAEPYRESNRLTGAYLSGPTISWTTLSFLPLIVLAAYGVIRAAAIDEITREHIGHLAWLAVAIFLFAYQGRFFAHYAITLVVPLAHLAAVGVARLEVLHRKRSGTMRISLALPILITGVIAATAAIAGGWMEWTWWSADVPRAREAAATVVEHSDPEDTLLVWGNEPQLYYQTDRLPAVPYIFMYPLSTPGYATDRLIEDLATGLRARPPKVIVDAGSSAPGEAGFLPLLADRPIGNEGRTLDLLDPLRDFVRANYREISRESGWIVYVLKTDLG